MQATITNYIEYRIIFVSCFSQNFGRGYIPLIPPCVRHWSSILTALWHGYVHLLCCTGAFHWFFHYWTIFHYLICFSDVYPCSVRLMYVRTIFFICFRDIIVKPVEPDYFRQVLDHSTTIFLRDEALAHCFPPCTTGKRENDYRKFAEIHLRSGLSTMALDGNKVVGACLCKVLTKDEVFNYDISSADDPSKWLFMSFSACARFYSRIYCISFTVLRL